MRLCFTALLVSLGVGSLALAADDPAATGPHGGTLIAAAAHHFEVVTAPDGVTVYPLTAADRPLDVSRLTGTATFYAPTSAQPWFARPLQPVAAPAGRATTSLGLKMDLSKVPAQGVKLTVLIKGLAQPAEFTVPFGPAATAALTVTRSTEADAAAIAAQKVCPVTHEPLGGEMGPPLKVARGDRAVFVCCEQCVPKIQANPDAYLAAATPAARPAPAAEYVCPMHPTVVRSAPGNCPVCGMKLSQRTAAHHH
jgi:hypothetical protein